ncbi:MAG: glycosyltransferase family 117 protein [Candidatus Kryptoniota bacterium]
MKLNKGVSRTAVTLEERKTNIIVLELSAIASLALAGVYLSTMSRSITYIDAGELTTVLWTLGIAHPTGYPLFTLLGAAFVRIPFYSEVAIRANLFAVICTALSGGFFLASFVLILRSTPTMGKLKKDKEKNDIFLSFETIYLAGFLATLTLGFSRTYWDQSTSVEVYSLQLLLFASILFVWIKFVLSPTMYIAAASGAVLGLGFTNHMTTILIVPGLLYLTYPLLKQRKVSKGIAAALLGGFILSLTLYVYLPLRSAQHPLLNWGDPETFKRFVWHVTGKQFRVWMFSSQEVFWRQLNFFFRGLTHEFGLSLVIITTGIASSFYQHRKLFIFSAILVVSDLVYSTNYDIHDIQSYFLLAYIGLSIYALYGYYFVLNNLKGSSHSLQYASAAVLLTIPVSMVIFNYGSVDRSKDRSVEAYTKDILQSLPEHSVVISYQWDDFVSASWYYQNVDNIRPDILVIDKELLRRSWYANDIFQRNKSLFGRNINVYQNYLHQLHLFENDLPYDPSQIESSYAEFIRQIILGAIHLGRAVFVGPEIERNYITGFTLIPYGLVFMLKRDSSYVHPPDYSFDGYRYAVQQGNDYSKQIVTTYAKMFVARAAYEYAYGDKTSALSFINKALQVDNTLPGLTEERAKLLLELGITR